jgi:hypothetical protein
VTLGIYFLAAIVIAVLAWVFGSFALRLAGLLAMVVGIVTIPGAFELGNLVLLPMSIITIALGMSLWLAGHWLYAYKHHDFKSGTAHRVLARIFGGRFDPTRGWGVPVHVISRDQ